MIMVLSFVLIGSAGYEFSISIPVTESHPLKTSKDGKSVVNDARQAGNSPGSIRDAQSVVVEDVVAIK